MKKIYTSKELNRLSKFELATLIVARYRGLNYSGNLFEELRSEGLEKISDLCYYRSKSELLKEARIANII